MWFVSGWTPLYSTSTKVGVGFKKSIFDVYPIAIMEVFKMCSINKQTKDFHLPKILTHAIMIIESILVRYKYESTNKSNSTYRGHP